MKKGSLVIPILFCFFMIGVTAFSDAVNTLIVFYMAAILYAAVIIYGVLKEGMLRLPFNSFIRAQFFFICWLVLSACWQRTSAYYISRLTTLFIVYVFAVFTSLWATDKERLIIVYRMVVYAGVVNALYRLYLNAFGGSINTDITGKNTTAVQMVVTYAISWYLFFITKKKQYVLFNILFALVALMTASRKSVVGLLVVTVMMLIINGKRKNIVFRTVLVAAVLLAAYWAITNIEMFSRTYERLMQMLEHLQGGKGDNSSEVREAMRMMGWQAFKENPVLGYGVGYSAMTLTAGRHEAGTYLHNNYVEVGVSLGAVGLALYYWPYLRVLLTSLKRFWRDVGALLLLTVTVVTLVLDYGMVSYFDKFTLLILNVFCIHANILRKEDMNAGQNRESLQ